jgi:hypothetical protein
MLFKKLFHLQSVHPLWSCWQSIQQWQQPAGFHFNIKAGIICWQ